MGLHAGPLSAASVHLCVDMQNLLGPGSPWHAKWALRVLPAIVALTERDPAGTIFIRFMPPSRIEDLPGTWRRYYGRWQALLRDRVEPTLLDLIDPLPSFVPPAMILDKPVYSPFSGRKLQALLHKRRADALIVSGGETDVCVLATVLGAIDRGYRVVLVEDGLCSSLDDTHDAALKFYRRRLQHQIEVASTQEILAAWAAS